jgi:8-oxo-dGTP pyrophosphatase MutT (NUDIX family)
VSDAPIDPLTWQLARYQPRSPLEAAELDRVRAIAAGGSAWSRTAPVHVTASALVVHPPTGQVLLRWHERQQAWLHVGGHGDPGEVDPIRVALREAAEETGLADLRPWPTADLQHLVIVAVPANEREPAHRHADLRFLLATDQPERARHEGPSAPIEWLSLEEAAARTSEDNLRETITRAAALIGPARRAEA